MTAESVDPSRCPLCGSPNACAMAADPSAKHCWCVDATIGPEVLDRLAPEARRVACICARCAAAPREAPS
jgi:cysteine-rich CWC protein